MKFKELNIKLNNHDCSLKSPTSENAVGIIEYLKKVSRETDYLVKYEEELMMSIEQESAFLENMLASPNEIMISAFVDNKVIGNASLVCIGNRIKLKHRSSTGIAILKDYQKMGLGSILMENIIQFAKEVKYEQIELEVASGNVAIKLYEKMGFKEVGCIPHGFKLKSGEYLDLIQMVKIL